MADCASVIGRDITSDRQLTSSVALGELDGDGTLDLVVGNNDHANRLYRSRPFDTGGATAIFMIVPKSGHHLVVPAGGSCGGGYTGDRNDSTNGVTYTTNPVLAACTVAASFAADSCQADPLVLTTSFGAGETVTVQSTTSISTNGSVVVGTGADVTPTRRSRNQTGPGVYR